MFSPDGVRLALFVTGAQGSSLEIWNVADAQLEHQRPFEITPGEDELEFHGTASQGAGL